jgi:hypothetical protein
VKINREELAWAAGFFDGEGSTLVVRPKLKEYLVLSVGQIDPKPLERFQKAVLNIGQIYGPYTRKRPNHQPSYYFKAFRFEYIQAIIAMLWCFLSPAKKNQYKEALSKVNRGRVM